MIYLDHHAATPICADASSAMREAEMVAWANPSSVHAAGRAARRVLESARDRVARSIECEPSELVLTSGGTEACNLGVFGLFGARAKETRSVIVTTPIEHPAVKAAIAACAGTGGKVLHLEPSHGRLPHPDDLRALLGGGVVLAAIQWVNHETGTLWPVADYANVCRAAGVPLFIDATQAWGKLPIDVSALGATAIAIAAHKAGGPAGAGALWVARGTDVDARMVGGGQERGRRGGSPDPVTQAGFGGAAAGVTARIQGQAAIAKRRDRLEAAAVALGGVVNGAEGPRVGTVTNVSFRGRSGAALVVALDLERVCCSSGAACSSGVNEPSPVLRALYPNEPWRASSAVRFSLGPEVTDIDVENAILALETVLSRPPA